AAVELRAATAEAETNDPAREVAVIVDAFTPVAVPVHLCLVAERHDDDRARCTPPQVDQDAARTGRADPAQGRLLVLRRIDQAVGGIAGVDEPGRAAVDVGRTRPQLLEPFGGRARL